MPEGFSFDELTVGRAFGPHVYHLTGESIAEWCRIHGREYQASLDLAEARAQGYRHLVAPAGMAFIFSLQALTQLRVMPQGVILAGHELRFHEPPCAGDLVDTIITVAEKYVRRERKYVVLEILSSIAGDTLVVANRMSGVWPH